VSWFDDVRDDLAELARLRAEQAGAREAAARAERDAQRQRETGWGPDGRYRRPTRADRDKIARGGS
jgi:septal ring factor EnvC (AmiA/AmiB activator)